MSNQLSLKMIPTINIVRADSVETDDILEDKLRNDFKKAQEVLSWSRFRWLLNLPNTL